MAIGASQALKLLVQFLSVILLARLLSPAEFGVFAMATPIFGLAMMFQDLGLSQATIQRPDLTEEQLNTLFWINVGVSVVAALITLAVSPLIGLFYADPRVGYIVMAFGAMMVANGLGAQPTALLNRHMRFGWLAILDASGAASGLLTSFIVAQFWPNFWALVAGSFAIAAVPAAGAFLLAGWWPGAPRISAGMRSILGFGANITTTNIAHFFARNADNVLIGRVWGEHALGLYDRAYKLLLFPLQQVNAPLGRVMLPVLSRMAAEPVRYRNAYLRTLDQVLLLVMPGVVFLLVGAPALISLLLGPEWTEASKIFQALGVAALFQPLNWTSGWLLLSQGRSREYMYLGLATSLASILAFFAGIRWGAVGVASAYAAVELLQTPLIWWFTLRTGPLDSRNFFRAVVPHGVGVLLALGAAAFAYRTGPSSPLLKLGITLAAAYGAMVVGLALLPQGRRAIYATWSLVWGLAAPRLKRFRQA